MSRFSHFIKSICCKFIWENVTQSDEYLNYGLRVSYNISLTIEKSGKPHTIGEKWILPAVEEVLQTVLRKSSSNIIKRISLSQHFELINWFEVMNIKKLLYCEIICKGHISLYNWVSQLYLGMKYYNWHIFDYESRNQVLPFTIDFTIYAEGESIFQVMK